MKKYFVLYLVFLGVLGSCIDNSKSPPAKAVATLYNVERVYRVHYEKSPGFYFGFFVKNEETNQLEHHNCNNLSQIIYQDVDEDKPLWAEYVAQEGYYPVVKLHIRKSTKFD